MAGVITMHIMDALVNMTKMITIGRLTVTVTIAVIDTNETVGINKTTVVERGIIAMHVITEITKMGVTLIMIGVVTGINTAERGVVIEIMTDEMHVMGVIVMVVIVMVVMDVDVMSDTVVTLTGVIVKHVTVTLMGVTIVDATHTNVTIDMQRRTTKNVNRMRVKQRQQNNHHQSGKLK